MSLPNTIASYEDCFSLFARAANKPKGSRALIGNFGDAKHFQMRMHQARKLQREETCRMYETTAPQYNKSEFDSLMVTLRIDGDGLWWVYVIPHGSQIEVIEDVE